MYLCLFVFIDRIGRVGMEYALFGWRCNRQVGKRERAAARDYYYCLQQGLVGGYFKLMFDFVLGMILSMVKPFFFKFSRILVKIVKILNMSSYKNNLFIL